MAGIFKAYDIRGTYPDQVNEEIALRVGYHFRDLLDDEDMARGARVVVSRDMRSHSVPLAAALKRGLRARGIAVIDIGVADTPQNYFAIGHLGASGGIQVTASHNPSVYNGFKMSRRDAIPVSYETGIAELERLVASSTVSPALEPAAPETSQDVFGEYADHVLSMLEHREPRLKLAADAANGMGTLYLPILDRLNVDLVPLYFSLDGTFPNHEANPLKAENLVDLQRAVRRHGCDLGVAFDGDADRAMIVDADGAVVTADLVTALLAPRFLRNEPGAVIVYDLRSSWATKEAIAEAGGKPVRERVGHSFIKKTMRDHGSPFGGELAGHLYYRDNFTADSSILTVIEVLNLLRSTGRPLAELAAPLHRYHGTGEINFHVDDKEGMIRRLAGVFADGEIDYLDGITVQYADWWFNVRPSNTEPLLRLVLEARTREMMDSKKALLLSYLGTPE
ncbi:MAG TPA: phosphomannomutase/phosphoglucomutase [Thermoanaerobaculales bacterium]|nr:phosphomannomutase/phosphoglucomutase [Thermoanaerobaculales bacterium]HQL31427.1 phosphomannomutase/phosphoglucomutase [Thermoanaerobaculales bacterium]